MPANAAKSKHNNNSMLDRIQAKGRGMRAHEDALSRRWKKLIDPRIPYRWGVKADMDKRTADPKNREKAVAYICSVLAQGGCPLSVILYHMLPRIPWVSFHDWQSQNADFQQRVREAMDIGNDASAEIIRRTAAGLMGFSSGDVKRDRLMINTDLELLARRDKRYRQRQVHENDADNPIPAATFIVNPIQPARNQFADEVDDGATDGE